MKNLRLVLKSALFALALSSFGSSAMADRLDDLSYCSNTCDYRCYAVADQARNVLAGFRNQCGDRPRLSARLTANGARQIVAHVGQKVYFEWSSYGASSASSTYYATGASNCATNPAQWVANTLQGNTVGTMEQRQVGCTYFLSFRVLDNQGNAAESDVQVTVVQ